MRVKMGKIVKKERKKGKKTMQEKMGKMQVDRKNMIQQTHIKKALKFYISRNSDVRYRLIYLVQMNH